ncbi:MAG: hypothetical protein ABEJ87_00560 [Candidatus Nanohalobium sp.]
MGFSSSGSGKAQRLVKEGNVLNYVSGQQEKSLVFFNETDSAIHATGKSNGNQSVKIYKDSWDVQGARDFMFFMKHLLSPLDSSKLSALMEEGKSFSGNLSQTEVTLRRSKKFEWNGYEAYNVTVEGGNETIGLTVHARRPYVLLRLDSGSLSVRLVSVNSTENPESYLQSASSAGKK